jgi:hypothetical protein
MSHRSSRASKRQRTTASAIVPSLVHTANKHHGRLEAIEERLDAMDALEATQRDLAANLRQLSRAVAKLTLRMHRSRAAADIDRHELREFAALMRTNAATLEQRLQRSQQEADAASTESTDESS